MNNDKGVAVFASTCPACAGARETINGSLCDFCGGEGYVSAYNGLCYHVPSNIDRFRDQYGNLIGGVELKYRQDWVYQQSRLGNIESLLEGACVGFPDSINGRRSIIVLSATLDRLCHNHYAKYFDGLLHDGIHCITPSTKIRLPMALENLCTGACSALFVSTAVALDSSWYYETDLDENVDVLATAAVWNQSWRFQDPAILFSKVRRRGYTPNK
jgi:hypothetical protein